MKQQSGYALLVILLLLAFILISMSVAVTPILTQAKREKEEELLFRGQQYQRAIGRFYTKFGRYPNKMDELIRTNDRSFLRRPYPDPMTRDGKWRIIRLGPGGQLVGSKQQQTPLVGRPPGAKGAEPAPKESSSSGSSMGSGGVNYPIVGVASTSPDLSIRVYEDEFRYDKWEFIYDPAKAALKKAAGAAPDPGGQGEDKSKTKPKSRN